MEKILGLDLGTNSIGWAIREINSELQNQIIDKGVLTFDKGVAEDKSGEHPMVQKRTESRGKRRNYQAEKYRKWELLECLIQNKMCPLKMEDLNAWRHYTKGVGRRYPMNEKFIQWLRFDFDGDGKPDFERLGFDKHESFYLFRALIVDENYRGIFDKEPNIIGRILYQLAQRRGFNDGQSLDEKEQNELSKTIMRGGGESGAIGVDAIVPYLEKYDTLGAALYHLQREEKVRIRKRYNLRSHYEYELKKICKVQGIEHLLNRLWGAIIWQRPLRSQKGLVGVCTFEKNKSRCPISHPAYEEFRTWIFINNLRIEPVQSGGAPKSLMSKSEVLHQIVYPLFFKSSREFKLSGIAKELKKVGYEITARFPEDTKVISLFFLKRVKDIYGDQWESRSGWIDYIEKRSKSVKYDIEDLWHLHFTKKDDKKSGKTAYEFLKQFAHEKLALNDKDIEEAFAKIQLQQGYATISLSAIRKIIPYLHRGFLYSHAVYLANLHKVIGVEKLDESVIAHFSAEIEKIVTAFNLEKRQTQIVNELISDQLNSGSRFGMDENYELDQDDENDIKLKINDVFGSRSWEYLEPAVKENVVSFVRSHYLKFLRRRIHESGVFETVGRLHDRIFSWIRDTYGAADGSMKYLWHPSEQETYKPAIQIDGKEYLGSPEPISRGFKNPMALKTLHKLKRLINYLIRVGKVDPDTRVVVELARELNDANRRKAIERYQRDREKENEKFKNNVDEINQELGSNFNREDKLLLAKIRLWNEQEKMCMYTGKMIPLKDILDGGKYDFEHTIPASMCFDNELKNLTMADKKYNQQIKVKKLPSECPNFDSEIVYEGIRYESILSSLQHMFGRMTILERKENGKLVKTRSFQKIADLENMLMEWKLKDSDDKEIKDNIVIRRHLIKMELDYWRNKLRAFLTTEYKSTWRNSQLRDTQTVTKYALPYLKTVFNKVEVQKGSVTSNFRKIFGIAERLDRKDRSKHSHHAVDAAVLTLIPPSAARDRILLEYNLAAEKGESYRVVPRNWKGFQNSFISGLEDEILINYQAQHRTLIPVKKLVRKRGSVQYVKTHNESGKSVYKLDKLGNRIPIISSGDSIRGQLHKESFFGAVRNEDALILVERYPISMFSNIKDCANIVDIRVRKIVTDELEARIRNGLSFEKAKNLPIKFPGGETEIKKVRCRVAAGRGYLTTEKALRVHRHTYQSRHEYKASVYAQNDQNVFCLYYELAEAKLTTRAFRIVGLFELASLKLKNEDSLMSMEGYSCIVRIRGKGKVDIPLASILKVGTRVILYESHRDEIDKSSFKDLSQRLYRIYKFNDIGTTSYIYLQNHIEARSNDLLGEGDVQFIGNRYQSRLRVNADKFNALIEGRDFHMTVDGELFWK